VLYIGAESAYLGEFFLVWMAAGFPLLSDATGAPSQWLGSRIMRSVDDYKRMAIPGSGALSENHAKILIAFFNNRLNDLVKHGITGLTIKEVNAILASTLAARFLQDPKEFDDLDDRSKGLLKDNVAILVKIAARGNLIPTGTIQDLGTVGNKQFADNLSRIMDYEPRIEQSQSALMKSGPIIVVKDPFDVFEVADLVEKFGKTKAMEAITSRRELLRLAKALADGKAATEIPDRYIKYASPRKELPYFLSEIWQQMYALLDHNAITALDVTLEEEIISSTIHHKVDEETYRDLSEEYKRLNLELKALREDQAKAQDPARGILIGLKENAVAECVTYMNAHSNRKTVPLGLHEFKLASKSLKLNVQQKDVPAMKGYLRQWYLTTSEDPDFSCDIKRVDVKSHLPQDILSKFESTIKTKAVELAHSILDLATVTQSSLNDLMTKCKQVFPTITVKNPLVFTEWPVEVQQLIQSAKTASKGVNKAITYCVEKIKALKTTKLDVAFTSAVLKCPAPTMGQILTKYGASREVELPIDVRLACVWCSQQSRVEAAFSDLADGKVDLEMFKAAKEEVLKQHTAQAPKVTLGSLLDGKKEKKQKAKESLKGTFTNAMIEAWIKIHGSIAQPAWVAKAAIANEAFVMFLIENDLCGQGTSGLVNHMDFASFKPTTLDAFAAKFYGWREGSDFFKTEESSKYCRQLIRDGGAFRIYQNIKGSYEEIRRVAVGADGSETLSSVRQPLLVYDIQDLKNRFSRLPAERESKTRLAEGKKSVKKSSKRGQKVDATASAAPKPQGSDRSARAGRGRSRTRSNRSSTPARRAPTPAPKPRSQSRGKSSSRKENVSYAETARKGAQRRTPSRGPAREKSPARPAQGGLNAKDRTVKLDGKSYSANDLLKKLPTDGNAKVALGSSQFTSAFLGRLLRNPKVETLESALDADGKIKTGYSWDAKNKRFVKSRPVSQRLDKSRSRSRPATPQPPKGRAGSRPTRK
jgi:hypothetical protein